MDGLRRLKALTCITAFMSLVIPGSLSAATISSQQYFNSDQDINITDCEGEFGRSFESCIDPVHGSPIIAKYESHNQGPRSKYESHNQGPHSDAWRFNTAITSWGTVTQGMFTLTFEDESGTKGSWSYDRGECSACPAITSYVVKGADGLGFVHYYTDPQESILSGTWDLSNWNLTFFGASVSLRFSHISFYDTHSSFHGTAEPNISSVAVHPTPLPAGFALVLTGLGVMGYIRRRSKRPI